jgi:hypothetical protein
MGDHSFGITELHEINQLEYILVNSMILAAVDSNCPYESPFGQNQIKKMRSVSNPTIDSSSIFSLYVICSLEELKWL